MKKIYDYAVLGGDRRQLCLSELLAARQKEVCHTLLCDDTGLPDGLPLEEALRSARCIAGPIPLFGKDGYLNQSACTRQICGSELLSHLTAGQRFFAGCIPDEFWREAQKKGIHVADYMEGDGLSLFNSIATAEGVICEAIRKSPRNLHGSCCAVLGYGACGRTLAAYLRGMFCHVRVYCRSSSQRAAAGIFADLASPLSGLCADAGAFDFVFNTIPALVVTEEVLKKMKPSALILDLASSPGGVDFEAAACNRISAYLTPGLPGIYVPVSSAEALAGQLEESEHLSGSLSI